MSSLVLVMSTQLQSYWMVALDVAALYYVNAGHGLFGI